jgi:hypothetical protein
VWRTSASVCVVVQIHGYFVPSVKHSMHRERLCTALYRHLNGEDTMSRFLTNALALTVIVLGSTRLMAQQAEPVEPQPAPKSPYEVCMDYCMAEHNNFTFCHGRCRELVVGVE